MDQVPIIDLANHHTPPRRAKGVAAAAAPVALSADAQAITLCAPSPLATGEQVYHITHRVRVRVRVGVGVGVGVGVCARARVRVKLGLS